ALQLAAAKSVQHRRQALLSVCADVQVRPHRHRRVQSADPYLGPIVLSGRAVWYQPPAQRRLPPTALCRAEVSRSADRGYRERRVRADSQARAPATCLKEVSPHETNPARRRLRQSARVWTCRELLPLCALFRRRFFEHALARAARLRIPLRACPK